MQFISAKYYAELIRRAYKDWNVLDIRARLSGMGLSRAVQSQSLESDCSDSNQVSTRGAILPSSESSMMDFDKPIDGQENAVVMIVDDDAATRMTANDFLTQAGFVVVEAVDGVDALAKLPTVKPDLIILDIEMPNLNGFDTCIKLRQMSSFASTPILMLTGLDRSESIDQAYEVGATDFATKPINWSLQCYRVRYLIRANQASEMLIGSQKTLAASQRIAKLGNWVFDVVQGRLTWSEQLFQILGYQSGEIEPSHEAYLSRVHVDDRSRVEMWINQNTQYLDTASIDHRIVLPNNDVRSVRQQMECTRDDDGTLVQLQAVVQDFTERRQAEEKIHQLAYYDSLTSLPNRVLFQDHLDTCLSIARKKNRTLAVLFLDLDDFKRVNDTLGHAVGDLLLREVAQRLRDSLDNENLDFSSDDARNDSMVARMGGDEFTILLPDVNGVWDAKSVAKKIITDLSQPYTVAENEIFTSPSIGISMYPDDGVSAEDLLRNADMAMYSAKRAGKKLYKVHSKAMDAAAQKNYSIDVSLRSALNNDEFTVFYQPQLDLTTGRISAVEALIRWTSNYIGYVSPGEFIPVAEENGLIVPMGEWVLRTSCAQAQKWNKQGFSINKVAVNISVLQFARPDFPSTIESILDETGLPPGQLELEITESLLANDTYGAVDTLRKLKKIGVELSIDDFGTGYSSLSQLKNFPIDRLKIDQSFIHGVTYSKEDAAIANAIVAMSDSMNIKVLAEGVETLEQLDFLRRNGCDEVQGYLISRPQPAIELERTLGSIDSLLGELFTDDSLGYLKTGTG